MHKYYCKIKKQKYMSNNSRELEEQEYNFNINTYSIEDLYQWFHLDINATYTPNQIEEQEYKMRHQLIHKIGKRYTNDIIQFLHSAKKVIVSMLPQNEPFSTLQPFLDNSSYPAIVQMDSKRENEIIPKPKHNIVYVQQDNFATGKLNEIAHRTMSKCLNIDTRFRDNGAITSSTDFQLVLPTKFQKVVSMKLESIELPITFYGISKYYGNSHFFVAIEYSVSGNPPFTFAEKKITIQDGNYTGFDLVDLINNELSQRNDENEPIDANDYFGYVSFSLGLSATGSGNGKITVEKSGTNATSIHRIRLDFSRDFDGNYDKNKLAYRMGINLGFKQPIYDNQTTYIAESILDPATVRYLYLVVDDFQNSTNNYFMSVFPERNFLNSNILARITLKGTYFGILTENDYKILAEPRKYFGAITLQKLKIQLLDDFGRVVDLNGCDFSFCLNFQMLYE
jgi:hypothetical protein